MHFVEPCPPYLRCPADGSGPGRRRTRSLVRATSFWRCQIRRRIEQTIRTVNRKESLETHTQMAQT